MAGMLQIITYLLCVYLVFKGVEIWQIGMMAANQERAKLGKTIGIAAIIVSMILAALFIVLIDSHALLLSESMKDVR